MDILIELTYAALVFAAFRIFRVPVNKWTITSACMGGVFVVGGIFLTMAYFHPYTPSARIYFRTTPIIPQVRGWVTQVPVKANTPLKAGDVLFKIEPTPFKARVDELKAKLELAQARLKESERLFKAKAGSRYDVELYQSQVDAYTGELVKAEFDLRSTTVQAPTDGFVTQIRLYPGMMAVPFPFQPVMTFVPTQTPQLVAGFKQNPIQNIHAGDRAEIIFPAMPGRAFRGEVTKILPALAEGQLTPQGELATITKEMPPGRVPVLIHITDDVKGYELPMGAAAAVAVYSKNLEFLCPIRQVLLRMMSWRNFICFEGL